MVAPGGPGVQERRDDRRGRPGLSGPGFHEAAEHLPAPRHPDHRRAGVRGRRRAVPGALRRRRPLTSPGEVGQQRHARPGIRGQSDAGRRGMTRRVRSRTTGATPGSPRWRPTRNNHGAGGLLTTSGPAVRIVGRVMLRAAGRLRVAAARRSSSPEPRRPASPGSSGVTSRKSTSIRSRRCRLSSARASCSVRATTSSPSS